MAAEVGAADRRAWLDEVTSDWEERARANLVEQLLWNLTQNASVTCSSDMWVLVTTSGLIRIEGVDIKHWPRFETHIFGDDFTLALTESYRLWRDARAQACSGNPTRTEEGS